jgi:hypothetical protein
LWDIFHKLLRGEFHLARGISHHLGPKPHGSDEEDEKKTTQKYNCKTDGMALPIRGFALTEAPFPNSPSNRCDDGRKHSRHEACDYQYS